MKDKNKTEKNSAKNTALPKDEGPSMPMSMDDSASDRERLKQETAAMQLPDVSDISGQEHITQAAIPGAMADSTPSSVDEERTSAQDENPGENDDAAIVMGTEADVSAEDLELLGDRNEDSDGGDDEMMDKEGLDDTDFDGEALNEGRVDMDSTGYDLDMPTDDEDRAPNPASAPDDEENDYFSLGSDDNDNLTEGTP